MLKDWLSLLLSRFYSKQESATVANLAMPSTSTVSFSSGSPKTIKIVLNKTETSGWERFGTYTAPTSGQIEFESKTLDEHAYLQCGAIWAQGGNGLTIRGFFPVAKGNTVSLSGSRVSEVKAVFVNSVGGGYKVIVWRAVLCLSGYYSFFSMSSLSPKKSGFRPPTEQTLKTAQQDIKRHLSHLQMATSLLFLKDRTHMHRDASFKSTEKRCSSWLLFLTGGLRQQRLESIKETVFLTGWVQELLSRWNSAFIRLSNLCTGGALC